VVSRAARSTPTTAQEPLPGCQIGTGFLRSGRPAAMNSGCNRTILARTALAQAPPHGAVLVRPDNSGRLRPPVLCGRSGFGGVLRALRRKSGQRCGNTLGGCIAGLTAAAMGLSPTLQQLSVVYARSTKLARAAAAGRGAGPATDEQAARASAARRVASLA
jgi:hypothetical protein